MKRLEHFPIRGEVVRYHYNNTEDFIICYVLNICNNICYLYDGEIITAIEIEHITSKDSETEKSYDEYREISYNIVCDIPSLFEAEYTLKRL